MSRAFTIIEMVVVIGIILMITGLILPNYRLNDKQLALERSIHKTAQDLRRIQGMAISAKEYDCGPQKLKGYGISFLDNTDYYSVMARCVNGDINDNLTERINLETGIKIKEIKKGNTVVNSLNVFFYPPDPETDIGRESRVSVTLSIESSPSQTRTIEINKIGVISIK